MEFSCEECQRFELTPSEVQHFHAIIERLSRHLSDSEFRARLRVGYLDQQILFDRNVFADSEDRQFMSEFLDNNPVLPLRIGLGAALLLTGTSRL